MPADPHGANRYTIQLQEFLLSGFGIESVVSL